MPPTGTVPQAVQPPAPSQPIEQQIVSTPPAQTNVTEVATPPVQPIVAKQVQQTPKVSLPSASECIAELKRIGNDWVARFTGKMNHNPHLRVAQHIQPKINDLMVIGATVTPETIAAIQALPKDPAVLDTNWQPEPDQTKPIATAKTVGEANIK